MATAQDTMDPPRPAKSAAAIPRVSPWLVRLFDGYLQRYIPRHFHAFAINNREAITTIDGSQPLIVYLNHASWWDPLLALLLVKRCFAGRRLYAPIDAEAVKNYPFMQRLGFFPVAQHPVRGAGEFLKAARAILEIPQSSIWLTPEGQFADPRNRSLPLQPGLAHLVATMEQGTIVPVAMEYPFWEERLPEALVRFGEPISIQQHRGQTKNAWGTLLERQLRTTQSELETLSIARDSAAFDVVLSGATGVSRCYDFVRRCAALFTGQKLDATHGDKLQ